MAEEVKKEEVKETEKKEDSNEPKKENEIGYTFSIAGEEIDGLIQALAEAPAKFSFKYMNWLANMKKNAYEKYLKDFKEKDGEEVKEEK